MKFPHEFLLTNNRSSGCYFSVHIQYIVSCSYVPHCYQKQSNAPNNMQDRTSSFRSRYTVRYRYVCRTVGILWPLVLAFSAVPIKAPSAPVTFGPGALPAVLHVLATLLHYGDVPGLVLTGVPQAPSRQRQ